MKKRTNLATWQESAKRWRISVQRDGVRKQFYSSTPGRTGQREAQAKADRWLEDGIDAKPRRVENIYKEWLEDNLKLATSESNWRPIEGRFRNWILPQIGKRRIDTINDNDLQKVLDKAYHEGKSKKTLSNIKCDMFAFFKHCRKAKLTSYRPEDVKIPAGARYKGKGILQPDALRILFAVDTTMYRGKVVEDYYINAYRFAALTGLRPGELLGLQWSDIQGDTVNIRRAINIYGETTRGKNQNAVRSFVLSSQAAAVLAAQREITGRRISDSVFDIENEKQLYRRWKMYCNANGLPAISPYELRHTFVSIVKTLPEGEIKGLVGHSQNMDTFGQYGHALTDDAARTAKAVEDRFTQLLESKP